MKARTMTYTHQNVTSAFEATGIWPLNARRVLNRNNFDASTSPSGRSRAVPATPRHGRAIMIHGRRLLHVLPRQTPQSKHRFEMVQKLLKAAARATAENVILNVENENLRRKATAEEDMVKTRSRKELSKAQVVTVEDVVRIRDEQEAREQAAKERRERAALKRAQAAPRQTKTTIPNPDTPASSRNLRRSNKKKKEGRKVRIQDSPISIESSESDWQEIDTDWESEGSNGGDDELEETIIVQPAARTLRSTTRAQAQDM